MDNQELLNQVRYLKHLCNNAKGADYYTALFAVRQLAEFYSKNGIRLLDVVEERLMELCSNATNVAGPF